jgi:AhpD family alkylhydroperoxidase
MTKNYSDSYQQLQKQIQALGKESPEVMKGVGQLHKASLKAGVLSTGTKELIALAIGIAIRCEGCIALHLKAALAAGATREEIVETIGVAVLMGGGPAVVYGSQALAALDQFEGAKSQT